MKSSIVPNNLLLHRLTQFHRTRHWPYPSGVCSFPVSMGVKMITLLVFASKGLNSLSTFCRRESKAGEKASL